MGVVDNITPRLGIIARAFDAIRLRKVVDVSDSDVNKVGRLKNLISGIFNSGDGKRWYDKTFGYLDSLAKKADKWATIFVGAFAAAGAVGAIAAIGAGIPIIGKNLVKVNSEMETWTVSLQTTLHSLTAAKKEMADIVQFAKETPFQIKQITEAVVKLSAYNMDTKKWLKPLGDMASAFGRDITDAVEAAADAMTGMFRRALSYGIKMERADFKAGGKYAGMTYADAFLMEVEKRFSGGMLLQSQTLKGLWSNIKDALYIGFQQATAPAYALIKNEVKKLYDVLSDAATQQKIVDFFSKFSDLLYKVIGAVHNFYNYFKAHLLPMLLALGKTSWSIFQVVAQMAKDLLEHTLVPLLTVVSEVITLFARLLGVIQPVLKYLIMIGVAVKIFQLLNLHVSKTATSMVAAGKATSVFAASMKMLATRVAVLAASFAALWVISSWLEVRDNIKEIGNAFDDAAGGAGRLKEYLQDLGDVSGFSLKDMTKAAMVAKEYGDNMTNALEIGTAAAAEAQKGFAPNLNLPPEEAVRLVSELSKAMIRNGDTQAEMRKKTLEAAGALIYFQNNVDKTGVTFNNFSTNMERYSEVVRMYGDNISELTDLITLYGKAMKEANESTNISPLMEAIEMLMHPTTDMLLTLPIDTWISHTTDQLKDMEYVLNNMVPPELMQEGREVERMEFIKSMKDKALYIEELMKEAGKGGETIAQAGKTMVDDARQVRDYMKEAADYAKLSLTGPSATARQILETQQSGLPIAPAVGKTLGTKAAEESYDDVASAIITSAGILAATYTAFKILNKTTIKIAGYVKQTAVDQYRIRTEPIVAARVAKMLAKQPEVPEWEQMMNLRGAGNVRWARLEARRTAQSYPKDMTKRIEYSMKQQTQAIEDLGKKRIAKLEKQLEKANANLAKLYKRSSESFKPLTARWTGTMWIDEITEEIETQMLRMMDEVAGPVEPFYGGMLDRIKGVVAQQQLVRRQFSNLRNLKEDDIEKAVLKYSKERLGYGKIIKPGYETEDYFIAKRKEIRIATMKVEEAETALALARNDITRQIQELQKAHLELVDAIKNKHVPAHMRSFADSIVDLTKDLKEAYKDLNAFSKKAPTAAKAVPSTGRRIIGSSIITGLLDAPAWRNIGALFTRGFNLKNARTTTVSAERIMGDIDATRDIELAKSRVFTLTVMRAWTKHVVAPLKQVFGFSNITKGIKGQGGAISLEPLAVIVDKVTGAFKRLYKEQGGYIRFGDEFEVTQDLIDLREKAKDFFGKTQVKTDMGGYLRLTNPKMPLTMKDFLAENGKLSKSFGNLVDKIARLNLVFKGGYGGSIYKRVVTFEEDFDTLFEHLSTLGHEIGHDLERGTVKQLGQPRRPRIDYSLDWEEREAKYTADLARYERQYKAWDKSLTRGTQSALGRMRINIGKLDEEILKDAVRTQEVLEQEIALLRQEQQAWKAGYNIFKKAAANTPELTRQFAVDAVKSYGGYFSAVVKHFVAAGKSGRDIPRELRPTVLARNIMDRGGLQNEPLPQYRTPTGVRVKPFKLTPVDTIPQKMIAQLKNLLKDERGAIGLGKEAKLTPAIEKLEKTLTEISSKQGFIMGKVPPDFAVRASTQIAPDNLLGEWQREGWVTTIFGKNIAVDRENVNNIIKTLEKGQKIEKRILLEIDSIGNIRLADGNHRTIAAYEKGVKELKVEFRKDYAGRVLSRGGVFPGELPSVLELKGTSLGDRLLRLFKDEKGAISLKGIESIFTKLTDTTQKLNETLKGLTSTIKESITKLPSILTPGGRAAREMGAMFAPEAEIFGKFLKPLREVAEEADIFGLIGKDAERFFSTGAKDIFVPAVENAAKIAATQAAEAAVRTSFGEVFPKGLGALMKTAPMKAVGAATAVTIPIDILRLIQWGYGGKEKFQQAYMGENYENPAARAAEDVKVAFMTGLSDAIGGFSTAFLAAVPALVVPQVRGFFVDQLEMGAKAFLDMIKAPQEILYEAFAEQLRLTMHEKELEKIAEWKQTHQEEYYQNLENLYIQNVKNMPEGFLKFEKQLGILIAKAAGTELSAYEQGQRAAQRTKLGLPITAEEALRGPAYQAPQPSFQEQVYAQREAQRQAQRELPNIPGTNYNMEQAIELLKEYDAAYKKLNITIEEQTAKSQELEIQIGNLNHEIQGLTLELNNATSIMSRISGVWDLMEAINETQLFSDSTLALESEVARLNVRLAEQRSALQPLQERLHAVTSQFDRVSEKISKAQEDLDNFLNPKIAGEGVYQDQLFAIDKQLNALQRKRLDLTLYLRSLEEAGLGNTDIYRQAAAPLQAIDDEIAKLQNDRDKIELDRKIATQDIVHWLEKERDTREEMNESEIKAGVRKAKAVLAANKPLLEMYKRQKEAIEEQIRRQEESIQRTEDHIARHQNELDLINAKVTADNAEVTAMKKKAEWQKRIADLTGQINDSQMVAAAYAYASGTMSKEQFQSLYSVYVQAANKAAQLTAEIEGKQGEVAKATFDKDTIDRLLSENQSAASELQAKIVGLTDAINALVAGVSVKGLAGTTQEALENVFGKGVAAKIDLMVGYLAEAAGRPIPPGINMGSATQKLATAHAEQAVSDAYAGKVPFSEGWSNAKTGVADAGHAAEIAAGKFANVNAVIATTKDTVSTSNTTMTESGRKLVEAWQRAYANMATSNTKLDTSNATTSKNASAQFLAMQARLNELDKTAATTMPSVNKSVQTGIGAAASANVGAFYTLGRNILNTFAKGLGYTIPTGIGAGTSGGVRAGGEGQSLPNVTQLAGGPGQMMQNVLSDILNRSNLSNYITMFPNYPVNTGNVNTNKTYEPGHLQPEAGMVIEALKNAFGPISYGGRASRTGGYVSQHPVGLAADLFSNKSKMDQYANWLAANFNTLKLRYIIWNNRITSSGARGWRAYTPPAGKPNTPTWRHEDHVHVSVKDWIPGDPYVQRFHSGGITPGARFQESLALLRGQEAVVPLESGAIPVKITKSDNETIINNYFDSGAFNFEVRNDKELEELKAFLLKLLNNQNPYKFSPFNA